MHFQSMFSHRRDGIPTQYNFDAKTRDAAQMLMAAAQYRLSPIAHPDDEAASAAALGAVYRQMQASEYACSEIVCVEPLDGNCWCFNRALGCHFAQAIDARSGQTGSEADGLDPKGESAVAKPCAQDQ